MLEKRGRLAEIIFRNEENYYTVAVIENDEEMEQYIAVGNIPTAKCGMTFLFRGEWKTHPSYGEQFAFFDCTEEVPKNEAGIKEFLASGVIRGIGPKMAEAIVRKFGEETLDIIEREPNRLTEVDGIGEAKAHVIIEGYRAHREFAEISVFFAGYGISASYAMRMYKIYGADTVRAVMENPYRLITEIRGIGFRQADEIAEKLGIEKDSEYRLTSGIRYLLGRYASGGNTYVPLGRFCEEAAQMLDVPAADIRDMAEQLTIDGFVRIEESGGGSSIYLTSYFEAENNVARRLFAFHQAQVKPVKSDVDGLIRASENSTGIRLSENQYEAVRSCAGNGVCVITGGPGTGKTTIINTIIDVFETCGFTVAIAAPTGRAAKRISETSGRSAVTIHRLLEYYYSEDSDSMNFGKNEENPLEEDVIIIDEMSMVDISLIHSLLKAVNVGTRLILVGDVNQLPSVGPGNVLRDMIASEAFPVVKLTKIFRQAAQSDIIVNAHKINDGEVVPLNKKSRDFLFIRRDYPADIVKDMMVLVQDKLPNYVHAEMSDIQIMTPMRKGALGVEALNKQLQEKFNPPAPNKQEKESGGTIFRVGDKVMQIKNNYQIEWEVRNRYGIPVDKGEGVFNGDTGIIRSINSFAETMEVEFDERRMVEYSFKQLEELELAYAITIHKSQGSEYPAVVIPVHSGPRMLMTRNLIYTAVTRAKSCVCLVGIPEVFQAMVDNEVEQKRYSGLKDRILEIT